MDLHYTVKPEGICASEISFDITDGVLHNVEFTGGCRGNSRGVALLAEGMEAAEAARRLRGVECHGGASCPDQLAQAIGKCLAE